jgi:hypothetical protein
MPKYRVELVEYATRCYRQVRVVEAESQQEAEEVAVKEGQDSYDWEESGDLEFDGDCSVVGVQQVAEETPEGLVDE